MYFQASPQPYRTIYHHLSTDVSPRSNRPMSARTKRATGKAILSDSQFLVPFVVLLAGIVLLVVLH